MKPICATEHSFPRYPKYKDSGVEWLGEIPEHWDVVQFKQFVEIQNGSDHKHVEQDEGYPVLGSGGVFTYASDFLYDGESVLLGRKGTIDKPLHVTGRFWTVDTMYWTKIRPNSSGRFAYYLALTIPFDYYATNTALPSMTKSALNSHFASQPPLTEQTRIAEFLDGETAKIDELVAEQRRLIELLKEKRQAVISQAVTRGLNPAAPLKPSGIEWLGDVPAHWEVKRLRYAVQIDNGPRFPINRSERADMRGEYPYWGPTGILDSLDHYRYEGERALIGEDGDHFNKYSDWSMTQWVSGRFNVNNHAHVVASGGTCLARWFFFSFLHRDIGADLVAQGATRLKLTREALSNLLIVCPPIEEQLEIIVQLELTIAQTSDALACVKEQLNLLQERRTALISAAVTGQIDVRPLLKSKTA